MATMKKAQVGAKVKKTFKSNPDSGGVAPFTAKEQTERRKKLGLPTSDKEKKAYYAKMSKEGAKNGKSISKAKNGKSFPDLNKDGKITKADVLKGRGVIAKKGAKIKKAQDGEYIDATELIPKAGPMVKTKVKERSPSGDYVKKTVTRTRPSGTTKTTKVRRTLQGYLGGAPRANSMKSGGSMKKCKYGCK